MNFFLMIVQMIPAIIRTVKEVETILPGQGKGAHKLNLVLNTVNAAAQASPAVVNAIGSHDLGAAVTSVINAAVATLNAAGAMSAPATPQP